MKNIPHKSHISNKLGCSTFLPHNFSVSLSCFSIYPPDTSISRSLGVLKQVIMVIVMVMGMVMVIVMVMVMVIVMVMVVMVRVMVRVMVMVMVVMGDG